MAPEAGEALVKRAQAGNPLGDLRPAFVDQPGQLRLRIRTMAGVAPAGDLRRVIQRDVQSTKLDEEPQMFDIGFAIFAVGIVASIGAR